MNWLRRHLAKQIVSIFVAERYERVLAAVPFRGELLIVTDCRLLRYDPEREEIRTECAL